MGLTAHKIAVLQTQGEGDVIWYQVSNVGFQDFDRKQGIYPNIYQVVYVEKNPTHFNVWHLQKLRNWSIFSTRS